MRDINEILISIRKHFAFLWDEYDFRLVEIIPRVYYRDYGYYVHLKNEWCFVTFYAETMALELISVSTKGDVSVGEFVHSWAFLTRGERIKPFEVPFTIDRFFQHEAEFSIPYLREMIEAIREPVAFQEKLMEMKAATKSKKITIDMIRAERARLHSLGLDSSLGAAMANLEREDQNG
jgi:hypothetical protein